LGDKIISTELDKFKQKLEEIHTVTAETSQKGIRDITAYQEQARQTMLAEIEHEKSRLLEQIDTKLADSVVAFLVDTLQHDVDLGAQTSYLTKMLEEHKNDFTGNIKSET
jgi:F0F1-type ATP synthase membrane subunit b/b'